MKKKILILATLIFRNIEYAQLNNYIEQINKDKFLRNAGIGFCVINLKNSELISEYNSHLSLIPASTLKIVTTSAAIGLLGSNFRYETTIMNTGTLNIKTGILDGDLIIIGSGDPTLQSENFKENNLMITDKWAKILKEKGLKEITGKIIADASYFERDVPDNWIWSDINNYYGASPCGISFMDNKFKLIFSTKEIGSLAKLIEVRPNYLNKKININSMVISKGTSDNAFVFGDPFSFNKDVKGTIPANKTEYEIEASLPDPALLCAEELYKSLIKIGITCDHKLIESNYKISENKSEKNLLYTHYSTTLDKIIQITNTNSNNHFCESLLITIGKGNRNEAINMIKKYWQQKGLNVEELFMVDGCGLSRANTITTNFQANLLSKIYYDSVGYKIINKSLPVSGVNGSMANIGKGSIIENNMRAKTGYIDRVRGYTGYVVSKSGKNLAFSILFNNYNCSAKEAKNKIEDFLIEVGKL